MFLTIGIVFGLLAMFSWGLYEFFSAKSVKEMDEKRALFWVQTFGLIPPLIISFFYLQPFSTTTFNWVILTIIGILGTLGVFFQYKAFKKGKSVVVIPIFNSNVVLTVVLSILFLSESLSVIKWISVVLILAGVTLLSVNLKEFSKLKFNQIEGGVKEALLVFLSWGTQFFILGYLVGDIGWFVPIFFWILFGYISVVFLLKIQKTRFKLKQKEKRFIPFLILAGFTNTLGAIFVGLGLSLENTSIIVPLTAAAPVVSVVLSIIFFKEKLSLVQKFGIVIVIMSIISLSL